MKRNSTRLNATTGPLPEPSVFGRAEGEAGGPLLSPGTECTSGAPWGAGGPSDDQGASPPPAARSRWKSLEREIKHCTARLRQRHADLIETDPTDFKKRAKGLLGRNLPPFAGRPTEESIDRAVELRRQGYEWKGIYPLAIQGHAHLDPATRRQAESNLRAALRSRRNAHKRRNQAGGQFAELNSSQSVPLA